MYPRSNRGLTLPELCFGLVLLAVLSSLAVPGFEASLRAAAVRTAAFELLGGLQQARANSILEARPGALCLADAAGVCVGTGRPGAGWQAFLEAGAARLARGGHALPAGIEVRATRNPLRFWPHSSSASTGTLTICDTRGVAAPRAIVLSQTGRARFAPAEREACA